MKRVDRMRRRAVGAPRRELYDRWNARNPEGPDVTPRPALQQIDMLPAGEYPKPNRMGYVDRPQSGIYTGPR